MKSLIILILIVIIEIMNTNINYAASYYIDSNNGNDSNSGHSPTDAWKTINKVNNIVLSKGDSVKFKGNQSVLGQLYLTKSGSDDSLIVICSYGTGKAIIENTEVGSPIRINNCGGIRISNLVLRNGIGVGGDTWGIRITYNTNNSSNLSKIEIDSVEFKFFRWAGISIMPYDTNYSTFGFSKIKIKNSLFHEIDYNGITITHNPNTILEISNNTIHSINGNQDRDFCFGIAVRLGDGNINERIINKNLVYNCGQNSKIAGSGITVGGKSIKISENIVYGINSNGLTDGHAIDVWYSDSIIVERNYLHNCDGNGVFLGSKNGDTPKDNIIRYNIIKNCGLKNSKAGILLYQEVDSDTTFKPKGNKIFNNTIVLKRISQNIPKGIYLYREYTRNTEIKNNIIIGDSIIHLKIDNPNLQENLQIQNNCYWDKNNKFYRVEWGLDTFTTIRDWSESTSQEKIENDFVFLKYNPLLKDPFTSNDTINYLSNLESYKYIDASLMKGNGLNNSSSQWFNESLDFYGNTLNQVGNPLRYDLGAYYDIDNNNYSYQIETKRWFGRGLTIISDESRRQKADEFILDLKEEGIFQRIDLLYLFAATDKEFALLNVVKDSFNLVPSGNIVPDFFLNQGFQSSGSGFLKTSYIPNNDGINYFQDSCGVDIYSMTDTAGDFSDFGSVSIPYNNFIFLSLKNSITNRAIFDLQDNAYNYEINNSSEGMFSLNRNEDTLKFFVNNQASVYNLTSNGLSNKELYICANNRDDTARKISPRKYSFFCLRNSLTNEKLNILHEIVTQYINEVNSDENDNSYNFEKVSEVPLKYELMQNFPNPFNPTTVISYSIPIEEYVKIKVFDISGKEILVLVNENKKSGKYFVNFNGLNLSSGVYFYKLETGSFSETRKMLLIK